MTYNNQTTKNLKSNHNLVINKRKMSFSTNSTICSHKRWMPQWSAMMPLNSVGNSTMRRKPISSRINTSLRMLNKPFTNNKKHNTSNNHKDRNKLTVKTLMSSMTWSHSKWTHRWWATSLNPLKPNNSTSTNNKNKFHKMSQSNKNN